MPEATVQQMVNDAALAYGINPTIFLAQMNQESGLNPAAEGSSGELGVGQFMPATWTGVILAHPELQEPPFNAISTPDGRSNALANVYAAAAHMRDLLGMFGGDYATALAGYNGGSGGTQLPAAQEYARIVLAGAEAMAEHPLTDADLDAALEQGGGGSEGPRIIGGMTLVNVATGERVKIEIDDAGNITTVSSGGPEPGDTPDRALRRPPLQAGRPLDGLWTTLDGFAFQLAQGQVVGAPRSLTSGEREAAGLPGATPGAGARTVEDDIEILQFQHDLALQRGDHDRAEDFKNQIAVLEKQQEFSFKTDRLRALDDLTTTILGLQQQARTSGIEAIGRDPFRGAIQAQGGTAIGRSPFERLRREQLDFAAAEMPSVGPGATGEEAQAAIDEAQGLIRNIPQRPIGLAHGGQVRPTRGGFTNIETGEVGDHLIVGERGRERIDMSRGVITVTPEDVIDAPRRKGLKAEHGGSFHLDNPIDAPTQPGGGFGPGSDQFSDEALSRAQTLFSLFEALGFDQVPLINSPRSGGVGDVLAGPSLGTGIGRELPRPGDPSDIFGALGTRPRLIFDPESNLFMQVNENTGQVEILGDITQAVSQFNINPADAVTMTLSEVQQSGFQLLDPNRSLAENVGRGPGGGVLPERQGSLLGTGRGRFSEQQPLISPLDIGQTVGILLPDPRMIAAVWGDLDIRTQDAVFSAYGLAGITQPQLEERIRFFTPQGGQTARGGGGFFNQRAGRVATAAGLPSAGIAA